MDKRFSLTFTSPRTHIVKKHNSRSVNTSQLNAEKNMSITEPVYHQASRIAWAQYF